MKLQKLLYYAQSLHLALYDQPLFDEEIQAWRSGSCVSSCLQVLQ
nr:type II toxin-antitoxin system antitoxin SocA domain-containing protein [Moorena sp. SIO3I8]